MRTIKIKSQITVLWCANSLIFCRSKMKPCMWKVQMLYIIWLIIFLLRCYCLLEVTHEILWCNLVLGNLLRTLLFLKFLRFDLYCVSELSVLQGGGDPISVVTVRLRKLWLESAITKFCLFIDVIVLYMYILLFVSVTLYLWHSLKYKSHILFVV